MAENKDGINISEQNEPLQPNYWRSFEDLYRDPALIEESHHEFKEGVKEDFNPANLSGMSRRKFLALIGASAALAGAGCADYPDKGEIIPYTNKPEEVTPGKANYYASISWADQSGTGILIKTREGRPIKVDGNPDHPVSKGKVGAQTQAHIMNLYDPERLDSPLEKTAHGLFTKSSWQNLNTKIISALNNLNGKEIAIISHKVQSPTTKKVFDEFISKYPSAKVYSYELFNSQIRNSAWNKCYGHEPFPLIKWNKAKVILALEADFLGVGEDKVENARLFTEARNVMDIKNFSRLYAVEGNYSLTGMNADYRLRLRPDAQYEFVMCIINEIIKKGGSQITFDAQTFNNFRLNNFAEKYALDAKTLNRLVSDLIKHKGESIIYAGNALSEGVHIAVNLLNEVLGNREMYSKESAKVDLLPLSAKEEWDSLISSMKAGKVGMVIHFGSNPAYHLPSDYEYASVLSKVPVVISLVSKESESSVISNYVLPDTHDFESWGDCKNRTGFYALQQPVIAALFNARQKEAVLLNWINGNADNFDDKIYHQFLMNNWELNIYPGLRSKINFKQFWYGALHDGVVKSFDSPTSIGAFNVSVVQSLAVSISEPEGYAILLNENPFIGDGRHAHNGWLQELPHPVSKISWDNYAAVSESTAKELGIRNDDMIEIKNGSRSLKIAVFVQPGMADKTIAIDLGYGRSAAGTIGTGIGFNANLLMSKDIQLSSWLYSSVSVSKTGGYYKLVSTQDHHKFDDDMIQDLHYKRDIIQEGTIEQYLQNPKFIKEKHHGPLTSLNPFYDYTGVKWAMSIDMNKCTGCAECVVACNVENNIPVVGKEQIDKGREMMWLRIDRYYSGSPDNPKTSIQPMLCQHCDHAPCENVCPVVATTHSPDGLNQMVYNRCVGTRYCSNNCPYKVRRFNYFNFRDYFKNGYQENSIFALLHNPEVTVRSRGVMEKCTFCIQRIMEAREDSIRENKPLKGSDVTTACQDACGTNAIKFGDMNDPDDQIDIYRNHDLGYVVLEELNIRPNVTYIAKLRNIHTEEAL